MKTVIAVLIVAGLSWSSPSSAATMQLFNGLGGQVTKFYGKSVEGKSNHSNPWNISTWQLNIWGVKAATWELVKFNFSLRKERAFALFDGKAISNGSYLKLADGPHYLSIFPLGFLHPDEEKTVHNYEFSFKDTGIQIAQTPIPAAAWLFAPALFATFRCRRKTA